MIPARLLTQEAVLTLRTQTGPDDEFGTPTWVETTQNVDVYVWPVDSSEIEARPSGRFTHRAAAVGITPKAYDALTLATGQSWEVDGPAMTYTNPRTAAEFVIFDLVGYEFEEESSSGGSS